MSSCDAFFCEPVPLQRKSAIWLTKKMTKSGHESNNRVTVVKVFPFAELKFFITAKAEIRAQRRFDEMGKTEESLPQDASLGGYRERPRQMPNYVSN